jgi:hypothetical protein
MEEEAKTEIGLWSQEEGGGGDCDTGSWIELAQDVQCWALVLVLLELLVLLSEFYLVYFLPIGYTAS